jgi:hypothetical protein
MRSICKYFFDCSLSVKDGTHIAKIALLGNYMATSFVTATDGHGGTLINSASSTGTGGWPGYAPSRNPVRPKDGA